MAGNGSISFTPFQKNAKSYFLRALSEKNKLPKEKKIKPFQKNAKRCQKGAKNSQKKI